jgi:hypothetical protein
LLLYVWDIRNPGLDMLVLCHLTALGPLSSCIYTTSSPSTLSRPIYIHLFTVTCLRLGTLDGLGLSVRRLLESGKKMTLIDFQFSNLTRYLCKKQEFYKQGFAARSLVRISSILATAFNTSSSSHFLPTTWRPIGASLYDSGEYFSQL